MFCRYYRMTPRQVDELDAAELRAFWDLLRDDMREREKAARRARSRNR